LLFAASVHAETDEIQVYDAAINRPGQFSLELQLHPRSAAQRRISRGGIVPNHTLNGVPEWARGITDWLELGAMHRFIRGRIADSARSTGPSCAPSSSCRTRRNETSFTA
jgi:hypothetical protein